MFDIVPGKKRWERYPAPGFQNRKRSILAWTRMVYIGIHLIIVFDKNLFFIGCAWLRL